MDVKSQAKDAAQEAACLASEQSRDSIAVLGAAATSQHHSTYTTTGNAPMTKDEPAAGQHVRRTTKLLYRPVGMASSVLGGVAASVLFKQIWKRVTPGDRSDLPKALERSYPLR